MLPRILTLVLMAATAGGCVTAESHEPAEDQTVATGQLVEADVVGRWEARASSEVIELLPAGVVRLTSAYGPMHTGTWRLADFGGTQYLVTVFGSTSAQAVQARAGTTLQLAPGGTYDLVSQ